MIAAAQNGEFWPATAEVGAHDQAALGSDCRYRPRASNQELPPVAVFPGGLATVLLVEPEANMRGALARVLSCLGYHVLPAADADEARYLIQDGPLVQLVFLNLTDPKCGDFELAAWFQALDPNISIVVATNHLWDARRNLVGLPHLAFLSQPYSAHELARLLRRLSPEPERIS